MVKKYEYHHNALSPIIWHAIGTDMINKAQKKAKKSAV